VEPPTRAARYYADGAEEPGRWRGRGAQALGLSGEVTEGDLAKVLAGRDPATGGRLLGDETSASTTPTPSPLTPSKAPPEPSPPAASTPPPPAPRPTSTSHAARPPTTSTSHAPPTPSDGDALPAIPPPPIDDAVTRRLAHSTGKLTAWELHQAERHRTLRRDIEAIGL
jgi:TrwC relaxase